MGRKEQWGISDLEGIKQRQKEGMGEKRDADGI